MRRYAVLAAIALQVIVLATMAGQREWILATGAQVYLRTAPIDPRDLFRGDYVQLRYEISHLSPSQIAGVPDELPKGMSIYAALTLDERGLAIPQGYTINPPATGLFLRGRTQQRWQRAWNTALAVDYGIEAYFVQQGRGIEIEKRRGNRASLQTPMEIELAVSTGGTVVIKGHRWSPLGIGLEVLPQEESNSAAPPPAPKLKLTLANTSETALALIDLPDQCSFVLEPAWDWSAPSWVLASDLCNGVQAQDADVIPLAPGATHTVEFDLSEARWYVRIDNGEPTSISQLPGERFRFVYRPPNRTNSANLREQALIWHGYLPSPAFTTAGRID